MIKKLLSVAFVAVSIFATAQTKSNIVTDKNSNQVTVSNDEQTQSSSKPEAILCINYQSMAGGSSISVPRVATSATPAACSGATTTTGYVCGSNCYGDKEKANYFPMTAISASIAAPTCSIVTLNFYKTAGLGTQGNPASTVTVSIYSGSSVATAPIAVLSSTVLTMAQIMSYSVSSATQFSVPVQMASATLPTSGGFFIGVTCPTVAGDSVVLFTQASASSNFAWEKSSAGAWNAMSARWGGFNGNLYMGALVCGTSVVGISESYGLGYGISMSPNPTSGIINMLVAPAYRDNLTVSVSNALGQTLINKTYEFTNESVALDLSSYNNGIYFVTVSNGKDKMVQRIVLNK